MTLQEFNNTDDKFSLLKTTCGATSWVNQIISSAPFSSKETVFEAAKKIWFDTNENDCLEAFLHHPEIGNVESLRAKYAQGKNLSEVEQSGIDEAEESILQELSAQNKAYKEKFGFIFIVFATGKSAKQMLDLLKARIGNTKAQEMENSMQEQWKITKLRLNNLIEDE